MNHHRGQGIDTDEEACQREGHHGCDPGQVRYVFVLAVTCEQDTDNNAETDTIHYYTECCSRCKSDENGPSSTLEAFHHIFDLKLHHLATSLVVSALFDCLCHP